MKTEFKDVAHLYLGCPLSGTNDSAGLTPRRLQAFLDNDRNDQPILRPLSDMTEEEGEYLEKHVLSLEEFVEIVQEEGNLWRPEQVLYLLKQGFDLFGLIESGQAIDKTTPSQPEREEGK